MLILRGRFASEAGFLGFYLFSWCGGIVLSHGVSFDSSPQEESLSVELWVGLTL